MYTHYLYGKFVQKDISRSLSLLQPALLALVIVLLPPWTAAMCWGQFWAGLQLLSFHYPGSPSHFLPFSHRDPGSFPFHSPAPCLTWIPGSLCDSLLGSPASLSLLTSVYFCSFYRLQECLSCFWAQRCLF